MLLHAQMRVREFHLSASAGRVLIAEDDPAFRQLLASVLRADGFEVFEARNGAELLDWIDELVDGGTIAVDLVISDVQMPVVSGLDVLAALRRRARAMPVILITAFGDEHTHEEAQRLGAAAVFDKPFDLADLRTAALNLA